MNVGGTVQTLPWRPGDAKQTLTALCQAASQPGLLVIRFGEPDDHGPPLTWRRLEPWTRCRAVTVADIAVALPIPALEVALTADLVLLREQIAIELPPVSTPMPDGLLWALGRAGRAAIARGLLAGGTIMARQALQLGLVQDVVPAGEPLPLPETLSLAALTTVRDLLRTRSADRGTRQLELASFRLLLATPDPKEGATAFLERRQPRFTPG